VSSASLGPHLYVECDVGERVAGASYSLAVFLRRVAHASRPPS